MYNITSQNQNHLLQYILRTRYRKDPIWPPDLMKFALSLDSRKMSII